jgi:hypothetical protein
MEKGRGGAESRRQHAWIFALEKHNSFRFWTGTEWPARLKNRKLKNRFDSGGCQGLSAGAAGDDGTWKYVRSLNHNAYPAAWWPERAAAPANRSAMLAKAPNGFVSAEEARSKTRRRLR